jgi:hypothetical protein
MAAQKDILLHCSMFVCFVVYLTTIFNNYDNVALNGWIGKDLEGNGRGLILRYDPSICLEGLRKPQKTSE